MTKEASMAESKKQDFSLTLQWFQLAILAIGVGGFFIDIGKRSQLIDKTDKDLAELKIIVQDLVKAQIQSSANDSTQKMLLDDLKARVVELERKK
jgi:predicted nucleotide-binding protein (sugar kinase/HSP70/actin superfamily)